MAQKNIEWFDECPIRLQAGMLIQMDSGDIGIVGDLPHMALDERFTVTRNRSWPKLEVKRWAWLIKPHELEWISSMAKTGSPPAR